MTDSALLQMLAEHGVTLFLNGDRLRFRAAAGAYTEDLRKAVAERHTELVALLAGWDQAKADAALAAALARCDRAMKEDARTDGQRRAVDTYRAAVRRLFERRDPYLFTVLLDLERAFAGWRNTSLAASAPSTHLPTEDRKQGDTPMNNEIKDTDVWDDLDFLLRCGLIDGHDVVNGRGFEECRGYPASRLELMSLARHWMSAWFDIHLWCWSYAQSVWDQLGILSDASERLGQLETIIGKDAMAKVKQEVEEQCRMEWGEETWDAFNRDDTEWRDRELERIFAELDRKDKARNTPETPSPDA
jgi:hypothetical protein